MIAQASSLPAHPGWMENLQYQLTGLLVVLFALGSIAVLVWVIGKIFAATEPKPVIAAPVAPSATETEIPGPVLATISAAVSVALEGRHFVIYDVAPTGRSAWSAEGRRAIYRSHQLR
ncbi:MAG: OadG family protein [Chthoniobacterales bacterium]